MSIAERRKTEKRGRRKGEKERERERERKRRKKNERKGIANERNEFNGAINSRDAQNQTGRKKGEMNNPAQKPGGIVTYFCQGCVTGSDLDHRWLVDRSQNLIRARERKVLLLVKSPPTIPVRSLELFVTHTFLFTRKSSDR